MMDFNLLTSLGFVVLDVDQSRHIYVVNADTPAWLEEVFGPNWNPISRELIIDDFSVIGMFIEQEMASFESRSKNAVEHIYFEENFGGNMALTGQITSAVHGFRLRFILRRVDAFDEISRRKLRKIRSEALGATPFAQAKKNSQASSVFLEDSFAPSSPDPSSAFLKSVVSTSGDAIVIVNPFGRLMSANPAALELFPEFSLGRNPDEAELDVISTMLKSAKLPSALCDEYTRTLSEDFTGKLVGEWKFEMPHVHKRKVTIQGVLNEKGSVVGAVWILSAVTSPDPEEQTANSDSAPDSTAAILDTETDRGREPEMNTEPVPRSPDETEDRRPTILIADDDKRMRSMLESGLKKSGFRTLTAGDGGEALEMLTRHSEEIIAVILDLAMPEVTGLEAFRRLNWLGISVPVIVASGFAEVGEQFAERTGAEPYAVLQKPYQFSELVQKIRESMGDSSLALPS